MNWTIPGTTLEIARSEAGQIEARFQSMFLAGGMVLSQITSLTGLDAYRIQNWVKRGFLPKPTRKRYNLNQLCRIITINMLGGVLPMDRICSLLAYVNGKLDDNSDDLIDDAQLYFLFVQLAVQARDLDTTEQWTQAIDTVLADYTEPLPGARERVRTVLRVMLTAWIAAKLAQEAEKMLDTIQ